MRLNSARTRTILPKFWKSQRVRALMKMNIVIAVKKVTATVTVMPMMKQKNTTMSTNMKMMKNIKLLRSKKQNFSKMQNVLKATMILNRVVS